MSQDRLNDAFVTLCCSLLQYVGENSPWAATTDQASIEKLNAVVARQKAQIQRFADFLVNRYGFVPHGTYPVEFTDLQYLSLAYLVKKMIIDQQQVLEIVEDDRKNLDNDPGARDMLSQLEVGIAKTLLSLKEMADPAKQEIATAG